MDLSTGKLKTDGNRSDPLFTLFQSVRNFISSWLIENFSFTDDDRLKAGVVVGNKEWMTNDSDRFVPLSTMNPIEPLPSRNEHSSYTLNKDLKQ